MFLKRSSYEILKDAAATIAQNSPITNFSAGSIARSIIEAMAPEIGASNDSERTSLYDFAQEVLDQGFLSKAVDKQLDLIGGLFSYPRRVEEVRDENGNLVQQPISNDSYRYEISQIVPSMATGNYSALRLALLTIVGIQDIIPKEYSHGTGSFSFVVLVQYGYDEEDIIHKANLAIDETKSFGVRPNIITPVKVPVDLTMKLAFHETTTNTQKEHIRFNVESHIKEHIGTHELGQGLIYNDLVQEIMNVNNLIVDFEITSFYLNNELALLTNQQILEDEQLFPQNIRAI